MSAPGARSASTPLTPTTAPAVRKPVRETRHLYIETSSGDQVVISSLLGRADTQVFFLDRVTGTLIHNGTVGVDVFKDEDAAIRRIVGATTQATLKDKVRFSLVACAVGGYIVAGGTGNLLLITKTTPTLTFPGGHVVHTVADSRWITFKISHPPMPEGIESRLLAALREHFVLTDTHYYCETMDVTRPFPSRRAVRDYDSEFVWNEWLSATFKRLGMRDWCCVLIQGLARCSSFAVPYTDVYAMMKDVQLKGDDGIHDSPRNTDPISPSLDESTPHPPTASPTPSDVTKRGISVASSVCIALITRKSSLHPGTRFLARGLNHIGGAGNECECELMIWTLMKSQNPVHDAIRKAMGNSGSVDGASDAVKRVVWCTHVWRRGTVPVVWQTVAGLVGDQGILIDSSSAGAETPAKYYTRLLGRYAQRPAPTKPSQGSGPVGGETSVVNPWPLTIVNLLRCDAVHEEMKLSEAYQSSARKSADALAFAVRVINFDFHHCMKVLGPDGVASRVWQSLSDILPHQDLTTGVITFPDPGGGMVSPIMEILSRQRGIIRYNCLDSLDRTGVFSFYCCLQVLAEMGRRLDIGLMSPPPALTSLDVALSTSSLPWGSIAWPCFSLSDVVAYRRCIHPFLSATLAELFVATGDTISYLYTNTPAALSQVIRDWAPRLPKAANANMLVVQRRYHNLVTDQQRHQAMEISAGRNVLTYFPSLSYDQMEVASRFPSMIFKPVPCVFKELERGGPGDIGQWSERLLSSPSDGLVWLCPADVGVVQLYIFLKEPCVLSTVVITMRHNGSASHTCPARMEIATGLYLDKTKMVFQGVLPRVLLDNTCLSYRLHSPLDAVNKLSDMYAYGEESLLDANDLNALTRVVHITFFDRQGLSYMSLGKVELLGLLPLSARSETQTRPSMNLADEVVRQKVVTGVGSCGINSGEGRLVDKKSDHVVENGSVTPPALDDGIGAEAGENEAGENENVDASPSGDDSASSGGDRDSHNTTPSFVDVPPRLYEVASLEQSSTLDTATFLPSLAPEVNANVVLTTDRMERYVDAILQRCRGVTVRPVDEALDLGGGIHDDRQPLVVTNVSHGGGGFSLIDALELEMLRISQRVSPSVRAKVLADVLDLPLDALDPATFPPSVDSVLKETEERLKMDAIGVLTVVSAERSRVCRDRLVAQLQSVAKCKALMRSVDDAAKVEPYIPQGLVPIANFPKAGLLVSVPSCPSFLCGEALLFPSGFHSPTSYWRAPGDVKTVEFLIVLPVPSVSYIVCLYPGVGVGGAPAMAYCDSDLPLVSVKTGEVLGKLEERVLVRQPLHGVEEGKEGSPAGLYAVQQPIQYALHPPCTGRIVSITCSLPDVATTDGEVLPYLHMRRLALWGIMDEGRSPHPSLDDNASLAYSELYRGIHCPSSVCLQPLRVEKRGIRFVDLMLPVPCPAVTGISLTVSWTEGNPQSQPRLMRCYCVVMDRRTSRQRRMPQEVFVVPQVVEGTELCFDFEREVADVTLVVVEAMESYGAAAVSIGKVAVYGSG